MTLSRSSTKACVQRFLEILIISGPRLDLPFALQALQYPAYHKAKQSIRDMINHEKLLLVC
jgi:hypothetical protein